ncbi:hypothetical protein [Endozoicomonas lisbonensis]|uniref:Uncharacterized protein n=1 Tax=Endozoicomonas lisbonensis TaxID=3120522 RepID=A0ABV2SGU9_9GAMM
MLIQQLKEPGTALVMDRTNRSYYQVRVPCFDPILDLDSQQARLNEAVDILSLLLTLSETVKPGQATDQAIAGAGSMLRRAINLISAEAHSVEPVSDSPDCLSSATS